METKLNEVIFDESIHLNLDLARLDSSIARDVLAQLKQMQTELLVLLAEDNVTEWSRRRMNQKLAEANRIIANYYDKSESSVYASTQGIAPIVAVSTSGALSASLGDAIPGILPTNAFMETIASGAIINGAVQKDWWARQSRDMAFRFSAAVKLGLINGETNQQIVRRVRDAIDINRRDATKLVRTSVQAIANQTRDELFKRNADIIAAYVWSSTIDNSICLECASLDNREWDVNHRPIGHSIPWKVPPAHMNCLPADSLVTPSSDVTGASKRWMDGEMVIIKTSSGNVLSCTPGHPILTNRGWVKAKFLNMGDNVVANVIGDRASLCDGYNENIPTAIHKITESFFSSSKMSAIPMPVSSEDFHGDGVDSKVCIVCSDSFLSSKTNTPCSKHRCKSILMDRWASAKSFLYSNGSFNFSLDVCFRASNSIMSCLRKLKTFFLSCISHPCILLLRPISKFYSSIFKASCDNSSTATDSLSNTTNTDSRFKKTDSSRHINIDDFSLGTDTIAVEHTENGFITDSEAITDVIDRFSTDIFFDNIVSVDVNSFHGYVYNIETEKGWYTANGVITHNCRCAMTVRTKTFRELGINIDEFPKSKRASMEGFVTDLDFKSFLDRKGKEFSDKVLGVGRSELYRNGTITFEQLIDGKGKPLSLKQLQNKYVKN